MKNRYFKVTIKETRLGEFLVEAPDDADRDAVRRWINTF